MTTARAAPALAAFLATLLLMPWAARADRPFISRDAAVPSQREPEIELGYFTLEQSKGGEHVSDPEPGPELWGLEEHRDCRRIPH